MPTMLYKSPGPHDIHGGKFDYVIVEDDQIGATQAKGWCLTTTEAKRAMEITTAAENAKFADSADASPPTREELEMKATELQIKFDGRTSDKKLRDLIAATLA